MIGPRVGVAAGPRVGVAGGVGADSVSSPPGAVSFIGASDVLFDEPGNAVTIEAAPPIGAVAGDILVMVIVSSVVFGVPPADTLPTGWRIIGQVTTSGAIGFVTVLMRGVVGGDPATHTITLADGPGPAYPVGAVLLAYRNLNAGVDALGISAVDVTLTGSFACPSQTLTTATDLYLGIAWVSDAAPSVTQPGGTTERFDASQNSDAITDRRLEIFEFIKGSTGATGTKTATVAGLHSGIAASILLKAAG